MKKLKVNENLWQTNNQQNISAISVHCKWQIPILVLGNPETNSNTHVSLFCKQ